MSVVMWEEEKQAVEDMVFDPDAMEVQEVILALRELQLVATMSHNQFTLIQLVIFGCKYFGRVFLMVAEGGRRYQWQNRL